MLEDTLTWLKGKHALQFGGSSSQADVWLENQHDGADDATSACADRIRRRACSTATNFPGASTADLNQAQALYAMLTGRVTSIPATARINAGRTSTYHWDSSHAQGRMREFDFFAAGHVAGDVRT